MYPSDRWSLKERKQPGVRQQTFTTTGHTPYESGGHYGSHQTVRLQSSFAKAVGPLSRQWTASGRFPNTTPLQLSDRSLDALPRKATLYDHASKVYRDVTTHGVGGRSRSA